MWRKVAAATVILGLAGCDLFGSSDDPAVTACEVSIKSLMKSPASYERESGFIDKNEALLVFEAQNPSGVRIKQAASCRFHLENGEFKLTNIRVNDRSISELESAATLMARHEAGLASIKPAATKLQGG